MAFEATAWFRLILAALAAGALGCGGSGIRKFPLREPLWNDPDRHPFKEKPEKYFSPFGWDAANQTIFRPISRFFAVDPAGESVNVNALDEVPDSSWFTNRIGREPMTPEEFKTGVCKLPPIDPQGPWKVTGAKPDGFHPGVLIEDQKGNKFVLKFDGETEGERPTAADVIGSRFWHAAGYTVPCNQITYFRREILKIDPEATAEESGKDVPLAQRHIDKVLKMGRRTADGRYRGSVSLFVDGKLIGPWTYNGKRDDDPNDVIAHEDRRELRGMRVLAAWTNHFDSREQNTMAAFIEAPGGGYVRHYKIDFGDLFGSIWEPPMLGRRIGHAYYLDIPYVLEDFLTLGMIRRPWDKARFGRTGTTFGYFNVELFEPDKWRGGYPNPAFIRASERDQAWMTRIVAEFKNEHIRAAVETGSFGDPMHTEELTRVLIGRRDKILRRYLGKLSPLSHPRVERASAGSRLCLRDLAVSSGIAASASRSYGVRAWLGEALAPQSPAAGAEPGARVCSRLPAVPGASKSSPEYLIVDVTARSRGETPTHPARVHLYHLGGSEYRVVGLERPCTDDPPG